MKNGNEKNPIVILGGGLAGLACAVTLARAGRDYRLVESAPVLGGRVRSRRTPDGFCIDEGFQVLLTSYPELETFVDLRDLDLREFNSGALIVGADGPELVANPVRHPQTLLSGLSTPVLSAVDRALVIKLLFKAQFQRDDHDMGERPTAEFLKDFGFSSDFIERFWRPFFTGIFLDRELIVGADFFQFLVRCFSSGSAAVPAQGMAALPQLLSRELDPEKIRLQAPVASWSAHEVRLESGEILAASQVVCAFDPGVRGPRREAMSYSSVTSYSFTSPWLADLSWDKWLVLVPPSRGFAVNHVGLMDRVAPEYSLEGAPLLSASVVGAPVDPERVAQEVAALTGENFELRCVDVAECRRALPRVQHGAPGFIKDEGVLYCGDLWASPSINGALRSGRLAAESLLV